MVRKFNENDKIKIIQLLNREIIDFDESRLYSTLDSTNYSYVYEENENILGFSILRNKNETGESELIIYTSDLNRERGIGSVLYSKVLEKARELNIQIINTEIRTEKQDTSNFFVKKGFNRWFGYCHMEYKGGNVNSNLKPINYDDIYYDKYKSVYEDCFYEMRKSLNIEPYIIAPNRDDLINNKNNIFLLLDEDNLIGAITLNNGEIDDLIVNKRYQNNGYGKMLLNFGINHYLENGYKNIFLRVAKWNDKAINIYNNAGFKINISGEFYNKTLTSIEMIVDEIDWTSAWSKKYPILASYQGINGINTYCEKISDLYDTFKDEFDLNDTDTVLILKDILYKKYKMEKKKNK